jgi:MoaD family protein
MTVKVKFFAYYRDLFGGREREVVFPYGRSLRDFLETLGDSPPRRAELFSGGDLKPHIVVMLNGAPPPAATGLDTPLRDADVISMFPFMGGG